MRRGFFEPSISLEETDEARGLIFCMGGHIVTLTGATKGIFEFWSRSWDIGPFRAPVVPLGVPCISAFKSKFKDETNDANKFKIDILDTIAELESVKEMIEVQDNVATCKLSHIDAVEKLGKNCHYPGSFQGKYVLNIDILKCGELHIKMKLLCF